MRIITPVILLMFFMLFLIRCTGHDVSKIKDNGEWVDIYDAPLTCGYILHDNRIYGILIDMESAFDEKIFWTKDINMALLLDKADINTFKVNLIDDCYQPYAKDKNNVYCPIDIEINEWDEGSIVPYSVIYVDRIIIHGADPNTFKYLGDGYAVDKNHMDWRGERIKWSDSIINISCNR